MQNVSYNYYTLKRLSIMAESELQKEFEVIVIGTGLEESIVAAACARNGHSVLHLDPHEYYGDQWASFTFDGLQTWIKKQTSDTENLDEPRKGFSELLEEGETLIGLDATPNVEIIEEAFHDHESKEANAAQPWTQERLASQSRHFNVDLTPRLLFSRGSMVELLISSNISRYTEFKSVTRVLTHMNGKLEHVPSSRADVFSTQHISVIEKRILMKYLTFCINYDEHQDKIEPHLGKPYVEFLKKEKLTPTLVHFILNSIAMVQDDVTCEEGLKATKKFLTSLGRFGNTPFLWPMYGTGELPQAFCRLSAVFGGTYYLGRQVDGLITASQPGHGPTIKGVIVDGRRIKCAHLVVGERSCPVELKKRLTDSWEVFRDVHFLNSSVLQSEKEELSFLTLPETERSLGQSYVMEVGHGASACPKGLYSLQIVSKSEGAFQNFIQPFIAPDQLIYSLRFKRRANKWEPAGCANLLLCHDPEVELDFDYAINHAQTVFRRMFGEAEDFLPRAPEPEEIILGGDEADGAPSAPDAPKSPSDGMEEPLPESADGGVGSPLK